MSCRPAPSSADAGAFFSSALAALVAMLLALPSALTAGEPASVRRADPASVEARVIERTNAFRTSQGQTALATDDRLTAAARAFARYMARSDRYGHEADGRKPSERAQAHGYSYCVVAENIAYQYSSQGFSTDELTARLIEGWQQSPGHRKNMLLPAVTDIGVGVAQSESTQRFYAVQLFGRPKSASTRFSIANRADAAIGYELDGRAFSLAPRVTRTHEGCFDGVLQLKWPDGPASPGFAPRDGADYTVVRDQTGQLRLLGGPAATPQ